MVSVSPFVCRKNSQLALADALVHSTLYPDSVDFEK